MLRTRYLLPLLVTLISCGAQNVTPPLPQAPAVASLDVSPASALLVRAGETRQLQARALDANGKEVTASVTWHSAGPGVTVDATGRVTAATAVGSSLVTARVGEVTSAPVAVIVAAPAEGALIVSDQQVLAVGNPQEGEAPLGSGSRYNVTLTGVPTPAPGTIVIASGTAPVSGRVISSQVAGNQVNTVLEVVRPDELFQQHSINLDFDLRDLSLSPDYTTAQPQRQPNGTWSLARPASTGVRPMAEQKLGEKKFERGPLACEASASAKITTTAFDISLGGNPSFSYQDANTGAGRHVKAAISGDIVLSVAGGVKVDAGFEGKAECRLVHRIPIPIGGPLSPFLMAGVPVGLGLAAEGKLTAATLEYRTEGKIGAAVELGIECKPNTGCKSLDKITPINEVKAKPTILPGPNNMRLEAGLSLFLVSGIDLIALGYKPYGLIEVTAGIRQDINLALTEAQALDKSYASSYELKLQAKAGLGSNAQEAIKKLVGPNVAVNLGVGIDYPLAKSPAGNLTPDKTRTAVGEAVEMVVELDPATVNYGPLGYNVKEVQLYRLTKDGDLELLATVPLAASNQTRFSHHWTPTTAHKGTNHFLAFLGTKWLPMIPLEVKSDSTATVEVGGEGQWTGTITVQQSGSTSSPAGYHDNKPFGTMTDSLTRTSSYTVAATVSSDERGAELQIKGFLSGEWKRDTFSDLSYQVDCFPDGFKTHRERHEGHMLITHTTEEQEEVFLSLSGTKYSLYIHGDGYPVVGRSWGASMVKNACTDATDVDYTYDEPIRTASIEYPPFEIKGSIDPKNPNRLSGSFTETMQLDGVPTIRTVTWQLERK